MNTYYIARHGQTEWNKLGKYQGSQDSPLTKEGQIVAKSVGEYLANKEINYIYHSPLGRAVQTKDVIAAFLPNAEITEMPSLAEMNFGDFEGKTKAEVAHNYRTFLEEYTSLTNEGKYDKKYPGGESLADVHKRLFRLVHDIQNLDGNILFIGHSRSNRMLRALLTCRNPLEFINEEQPNNVLIALDRDIKEGKKPKERLINFALEKQECKEHKSLVLR